MKRALRLLPVLPVLVFGLPCWSPTGVALFGSDVYVPEFLHTVRDVRRNWLPRVRKITSDGTSTIIATIDQMPGVR